MSKNQILSSSRWFAFLNVFWKSEGEGASPFWPKRHLDDGWWRLFFKGVTFQNYDTNWTFGKNRPKGDAFNEFGPTLVFLWEHQLFGFISFLNIFFAKTGKFRFYTSVSDFFGFSQNINFTLYYTIFLDFLKKIQGSYLRIFSKNDKKSSFEL